MLVGYNGTVVGTMLGVHNGTDDGSDVGMLVGHCSDLKFFFVKDQDNWEEETNSNPKLKESLNEIAVKDILSIFNFFDEIL